MKPYAAPCYLTSLKTIVCMVIVVVKRTWLAVSTKDWKRKRHVIHSYGVLEHRDAPTLKLRWDYFVFRIKQRWFKPKKKNQKKNNPAQKVCMFYPFKWHLTFFKVWQKGAAYLHSAPFPKAANRSLWTKNFLPAWPVLCTGRRRELSAPSFLSPLSDTWSRNLSISASTLTATTFLHSHAFLMLLLAPPRPLQCIPVASLVNSLPFPPSLGTSSTPYSRSLHPWAHPVLL